MADSQYVRLPVTSESDTQDSSIQPTSYTPLPDGPYSSDAPAPNARRPIKQFFAVITGLLLLASLVAIIAHNQRDKTSDVHLDAEISPPPTTDQDSIPTMQAVSRGVSAGVSEKANGLFIGDNVESYPWNNSMLSWQRTAYHFQPEKNWMNDPNGPMYYRGWYHFFYQYNPNAAVWGDIVWGHAISTDLIHWLHLPLAMLADQWYDINGVWTGSATILPDGKIIMLYTGSTNESVQVQNLAFPEDPSDPLLIKWVKYSGNPVLVPPPGIGYKDFRDPTTAWLTSEGNWRIVIGSKINKTGISLVYDTKDFKNYKLLKNVFNAVPGTGMWECVDFFPVSKTSDKGLDTSTNSPQVKHVVKVSLDDDRHDYYALGSYDENNVRFVADIKEIDVGIGLRYDYGIFYASKTFYDDNKERRVLWGWIGESDSEFADVKKGWASVQAVPRTILLDRKTGGNLLQWPVEEVESLRLESQEFESIKLKPGSVVPLDVGTATQLDILAEFDIIDKEAVAEMPPTNSEYNCGNSGGAAERGALGPFGLLVLADESLSEYTPVYFYVTKGSDGNFKASFCSDQSRSSQANDVNKKIFGNFVPVLKDEKLSIRILVDHSIVESFAQGGRTCITSRVYPTKAIYGDARVFVFNNATNISVIASARIWQMNSAFIRPYDPEDTSSAASMQLSFTPFFLVLVATCWIVRKLQNA